jgi:carbamoyl-phosphate synthase large subunit
MDELEATHRRLSAELAGSMLQRFCPLPEDQLVIAQEIVDGPECCVDVVNDLQGNYVTHFACRVHAMRAGESDSVTTIDPSFVGDLPQRLSRITRHPGLWGIDLMIHNNVPKIIDINPRFTGDYPFHHIAGANIPAALLAWAYKQTPHPEWLKPQIGVEGYKDLVPQRRDRNGSASLPAPVATVGKMNSSPTIGATLADQTTDKKCCDRSSAPYG